ncbi:MAG: histone family protein [Methanobrevibacter thaueri]|uniref:Histone family protein n=2 Tax=Methanobrevibacter TaxID=2172 RepID=A0A8T3VDM9_9EURY|nr:histone family protein [Methanobrevibacter thaueri]
MAIPKAPVKRTIQEAGAERVSADAVDALTEHIEEYMEELSKRAIVYAKYAKRKTVKAEDIALAIDSSAPIEAPEDEKHDMFSMIKNVFEGASEGKGFEEIMGSFMKMNK